MVYFALFFKSVCKRLYNYEYKLFLNYCGQIVVPHCPGKSTGTMCIFNPI